MQWEVSEYSPKMLKENCINNYIYNKIIIIDTIIHDPEENLKMQI